MSFCYIKKRHPVIFSVTEMQNLSLVSILNKDLHLNFNCFFEKKKEKEIIFFILS